MYLRATTFPSEDSSFTRYFFPRDTKTGTLAEVVEVVVDGRDAQGGHGGDVQRAVEGAQPGQGPGQAPEVIQQVQKPHHKLQQHPGNQVESLGQIVEVSAVRGAFFTASTFSWIFR